MQIQKKGQQQMRGHCALQDQTICCGNKNVIIKELQYVHKKQRATTSG
jgi:hypothetical protein